MSRLAWCIVLALAGVIVFAVQSLTSTTATTTTTTTTTQTANDTALARATLDSQLNRDGAAPIESISPGDNSVVSALESEKSAKFSHAEHASASDIEKWVTASASVDANARAAANESLLHAPRANVLAVLQHVVGNGNADDRETALSLLHMLALKQGDTDDAIKNILRLTSYDGDDALAGDAQLALDDIERNSERMVLLNP